MNKPEGPLEAIGEAIGKIACFPILAITAITAGTALAAFNLLNGR